MLKVGFIAPIDNLDWIYPIIIVPKKNKKLRICVDYRKLNAVTILDPFPLPYMDSILDEVAGHEIYSFLDGFSGYNQIRMAPKNQADSVHNRMGSFCVHSHVVWAAELSFHFSKGYV